MRALLVAAMAGLAALPGAAGAQTASPPIEAYSRLPATERVKLSTDGSRLALVVTEGSRQYVELRAVGSDKVGVRLDLGGKLPRQLEWVSPSDLLLLIDQVLPAAPGLIHRQKVNQAIIYDAQTRRSTVLLKDTPDALPTVNSWPERGSAGGVPFMVVEGFNPSDFGSSFYRVDLRTGRGTKLDDGSLASLEWLARPDGTLVAKSERRERGPWVLKARRDVGWAEVASLPPGPGYPTFKGLGRDGRSLLVSGGPNNEPGLFEISLETGAWSGSLTPPGREITYVLSDHGGDGRVLAAALSGTPELVIFDPRLKRAWASVEKSFPGKRVELFDVTDDLRKLVVRTSGPTDPGSFYFFDLDAKRAEAVGESYPELEAAQIAPVREITFAARDGMQLHGVLTLPPGREPKGLPLIVLSRGEPPRRESADFDWRAQAIASRGYAVLKLSAEARPGATPNVAGLARRVPQNSADAVRFLAGQGVVDPARVCGVGEGLGGWAAVSGVTWAPLYRCAVSINGVLDLRRQLNNLRDLVGGAAAARTLEFQNLIGVSGPRDSALDVISPLEHAKEGRAPVLLLHGAENTSILPAHSRALQGAFKAADRPVEYVALPGDDMILLEADSRRRMLSETLRFLLANNPPN